MKKWLLLLLFCLPLAASAQASRPLSCTLSTTQTCKISNGNLAYTATFEEVLTGSPTGVSVTVAGCTTNDVCDSAVDTNTSTSNAIRAVTFAKAYDYFLVTATLSGGTAPKVKITPLVSTARLPNTTPVIQTGGVTTAITAPSANATKLWGLVPTQTLLNAVNVKWTITTTADNNSGAGHNYGLAVLDANCTLLVSTGALPGTTFSPSTGQKGGTWANSGALTLIAGQKYYLAWTTDCASACAQLGGGSQGSFLIGGAGATTSGGVPAGTTCAVDSPASGNYPGVVLY